MTRPQSASVRSQHPTACIECEDELATSWCEECRTSLCEECDLHQHHPKSLRREHIRTPIIPPDAPPAAAPRAGLLSKAFASEGTAWDAEGDEESAEDGPADSGLTSDNQGGFNSGVKLESGTSHHGLKSKRKHKKKRGKSRGHSKDRVEGGGNEAERHDDRSAERSSTERPIGQSSKDESAEKDGESGGSSSIEHPTKHPAWKKYKSSLKGSHEAAGEGPRHSLHVHWSPDVKDHTAEDHSPSYGSPRRFVPFISNRRKKYAEKHHKKHHKGAAEHGDKRGKGKGRKGHEAPRSPGAKKAHLETAPTTGLSDASESADSDAFSPVWPRDSSDKSEGTSDDSSFEDKMEPRHRAPDVQLKLPEGRTAKGSEGENEEVFEEQGARAASEAGLKMSEEVAALKREGAALKAVPFGEIVSSSGAEDTAEESATEDDSMAGGMDLDSSETEMLAGGAREQPPGRSWKWFERFMGKKKADAPESKGLASEKGKAPRSRKGPAKKGLVDDKGGFGSFPTVEKSPLGLSSGQGGRAELGAGAQFGRTSPAKGLAKEAPSETNMEKPLGELETARFRVESGDRLAQGGGIVKAVCEYEAAIRLFRSQSDGVAGRRALQGEAQAWEKIAALQKQEENGAAAGRGYLSAARVYQKLGMEAEMGACLQQARELQKMEGGDEEVAKTGQKAGLEGKGARKENEEKDSEEKKGTLEGDADDETTRGTREFGLGNTSVEQDKVLPGQGSTVALSGSPQSVQSSNMQDLAQGLVYSNEEAKGASSKRAPKKKGKGPTTKSTPESGVAKTAPGERSDDGVQAETTQPRPTVSPGAPAKNRDLVGSGTAGGASQADTAASIARSRKFGAAAVASGDADKGKALLVGALVAARKGGVKAEEARCLRLLADSQATDDQRVRTLEQAVQGMHDSGLRLEEAEALYRLADTKLTQYLGNKAAIQAAVSGMPGREEVALVESARTSLLAAAQILQGADLWKGPETAPERTPREILSPTRTNRPEVVTIPARGKFAARNGRGGENAENGVTFGKRGPSVGVPIKVGGPGLSGRNPDEVRVLRELYGQVCQGVGKASILLGQMGAAKEKFQEALSNVEWTSKYGDEAKRVQDIMGRLPR